METRSNGFSCFMFNYEAWVPGCPCKCLEIVIIFDGVRVYRVVDVHVTLGHGVVTLA
jgi:hypothetical protein